MTDFREIFVFDYGRTPRTSHEESLAGDMSRTLALAASIREELSGLGDWRFDAPQLHEEYGAVVWFQKTGNPTIRSLLLEPLAGHPFTWTLQVVEHHGCAGVFFPRRVDEGVLKPMQEALDGMVRARPEEFRNARWITRREYRRYP